MFGFESLASSVPGMCLVALVHALVCRQAGMSYSAESAVEQVCLSLVSSVCSFGEASVMLSNLPTARPPPPKKKKKKKQQFSWVFLRRPTKMVLFRFGLPVNPVKRVP